MGKASKKLKQFIESIPDDKLVGFTDGEHTLFTDDNYRLDHQGLTTGNPQYYNLQVQVNRETKISTLKKEVGKTVATALVPVGGGLDAAAIRAMLLDEMMI